MKTPQQAWWHVHKLAMVMGVFYGCFVVGVRYFEWNWLRNMGVAAPAITPRFIGEMLVAWVIIAPLAVSLVYSAIRRLLVHKAHPEH